VEFFADRNLGARRFPAILRAAGVTLDVHQDHFPQDALDVVWMPDVASRGWIILSPDIRIARDRLEVHAIMTSGASVFCLSGAGTARRRTRRRTSSAARVVERTPPPFIAKVYRPNPDDPSDTRTRRVDVKLTRPEWEARRRKR
jgi:hypothetical protein